MVDTVSAGGRVFVGAGFAVVFSRVSLVGVARGVSLTRSDDALGDADTLSRVFSCRAFFGAPDGDTELFVGEGVTTGTVPTFGKYRWSPSRLSLAAGVVRPTPSVDSCAGMMTDTAVRNTAPVVPASATRMDLFMISAPLSGYQSRRERMDRLASTLHPPAQPVKVTSP
jgi:hypothetical protein